MPIYTNCKILWVIIGILMLVLIPYPEYKKQLSDCAPKYWYKTERPNSKTQRDRSVIDGQTPCQPQRNGWVWRPPFIITLYQKLQIPITRDIPITIKPKIPNQTPSPTTSALPDTCPKTEWVDCMPGPDKSNDYMQTICNSDYLQWAKDNCPEFKGAAY